MFNTEIRIVEEGDEFVPDISSVPIVPGHKIQFFADPDLETDLCMTAETAAILMPHPELTVTIAAGHSKTFEFSEARPGKYCILTQAADWPFPDHISCGAEPIDLVLSIQPAKPPHYSGPDSDPQT